MSYYQMGLATPTPTIIDRGLEYYRHGRDIGGKVSIGTQITHRAYRDGLGVSQGTFVGALVATPSYLRDQIMASAADVTALDNLISSQADITGWNQPNDSHIADPIYIARRNWWRAVWQPFIVAWSAFKVRHDGEDESIWLSNFWGSSVWDQIQEWRRKIIAIREAAEGSGFDFKGVPAPNPPDAGLVDRFGALMWGAVKVVIMAGIIMIVAVSITKRV